MFKVLREIIYVVMIFCLLTSASSAGEAVRQIERASFKGDWPFTVSKGMIGCIPLPDSAYPAILFSHQSHKYPLNGVASARAKRYGWKPLEDVWRIKQVIGGVTVRVSVHDMIQYGLSICH